jgi:hypothetical protein
MTEASINLSLFLSLSLSLTHSPTRTESGTTFDEINRKESCGLLFDPSFLLVSVVIITKIWMLSRLEDVPILAACAYLKV